MQVALGIVADVIVVAVIVIRRCNGRGRGRLDGNGRRNRGKVAGDAAAKDFLHAAIHEVFERPFTRGSAVAGLINSGANVATEGVTIVSRRIQNGSGHAKVTRADLVAGKLLRGTGFKGGLKVIAVCIGKKLGGVLGQGLMLMACKGDDLQQDERRAESGLHRSKRRVSSRRTRAI